MEAIIPSHDHIL